MHGMQWKYQTGWEFSVRSTASQRQSKVRSGRFPTNVIIRTLTLLSRRKKAKRVDVVSFVVWNLKHNNWDVSLVSNQLSDLTDCRQLVIPLALISISVQIDVSFYHYFPWLNSSEVPQMKIDTVIFQDVLGCCTNSCPSLADQVLCVQQVIYIPVFTEMCQHKTTASPNKVTTSLKRKWFILPNPGMCLPLVSHNHVSGIVSYEDNVDNISDINI